MGTKFFFARHGLMWGGLAAATVLHHFIQELLHPTATWQTFLLMAVVVTVLYFILQWAHGYLEKNLSVQITPLLLSTEGVREEEARKGLIVFLPLYFLTPAGKKKWQEQHGYDPSAKTEAERLQADLEKLQKGKDFRGLLIDDSAATNFGPATLAIATHSKRLSIVWIVTSESSRDPAQSSNRFVETYIHYLRQQSVVGQSVEFKTTRTVNVDEDSQVAQLACAKLQEIYAEARKKPFRLKETEIIVDVTSGTKSMTTGAVLGSIAKGRDIQLLAARYERGGGLKQASDPVVLKYEAVIPRTHE